MAIVTAKTGETLCAIAIRNGFPNCNKLRAVAANSSLLVEWLQKGDKVTVVFEFTCRAITGVYILGGGITEIRPDGRILVCHLARDVIVFTVEGKRLNGLMDPVSDISIVRGELPV